MPSIKDLFIALGIETGDSAEKLDEVDDATTRTAESMTARLGAATKVAGAGMAAVAASAVAAGAALFGLTRHAAATGAAIDDAANRVGKGVREYQRLSAAVEATGGDAAVLAEGLRTFDVALTQAGKGAGPAREAIAALGVDLGELANLETEGQLARIADAFGGVEDSAQRTAIAAALFGGAGAKLRPLLEEGGAAIAAYGDEAERLGLVLGEDLIDRAAALDDQLSIVGKQLDTALVELGSAAIPVVAEITGGLSEWIAANRELIATKFAEFLEELVPVLLGTFEAAGKVVEVFADFVDASGGIENALIVVAGGVTAIKVAGLGIPGVMAAATASIGVLGAEAIAELSGVNAEIERLRNLERETQEQRRDARGIDRASELLDLSGAELARLDDRSFARELDKAKAAVKATAALASAGQRGAGGAARGLELAQQLEDDLTSRRDLALANAPLIAAAQLRDRANAAASAASRTKPKAAARGGGGGGDSLAILGGTGLDELIANAGANLGATDKAIASALEGAAASLREGAAVNVARDRAISTLEGLTGRKLGGAAESFDPLLRDLLGIDVAAVTSRAAIASTGSLAPQTLINTTNNAFSFAVEIKVDGDADPEALAERIGGVVVRHFKETVDRTAREIEVTINR